MQDSGSNSGSKAESNSESGSAEPAISELRRARRAKLARPMRVRPSEPRDDHFEDLPNSVNASKHGIYFVSKRSNYYKGMRVFVTFPYTSAHDPMTSEYLAEVVRIDTLPNGKFGIAVDLKMSVNMSSRSRPGPRA
ncbi:MAG TPA: hypothetical protein VIW23_05900 [Candidatus Acidoferrum sp.]|jgi:hypothetical protein